MFVARTPAAMANANSWSNASGSGPPATREEERKSSDEEEEEEDDLEEEADDRGNKRVQLSTLQGY